MVVVEACGWGGNEEGGRRGVGVGCVGMWCVWAWVGGGGREGEGGGEEATDSTEHQISYKQSLLSGLD